MKVIKTVFLAFAVVAITVGVLCITNKPVVFKKATWDDVVAESNMGGYQLIGTNELWERYSKNPESTLVVDTRQEWEYRTGHIQSALNFPIETTWLSRWRKKGDLETFIGPDKDRHVVFY